MVAEPSQSVDQRVEIARWKYPAALRVHHSRGTAGVGGNHGQTARHRLEQDQSQAFERTAGQTGPRFETPRAAPRVTEPAGRRLRQAVRRGTTRPAATCPRGAARRLADGRPSRPPAAVGCLFGSTVDRRRLNRRGPGARGGRVVRTRNPIDSVPARERGPSQAETGGPISSTERAADARTRSASPISSRFCRGRANRVEGRPPDGIHLANSVVKWRSRSSHAG